MSVLFKGPHSSERRPQFNSPSICDLYVLKDRGGNQESRKEFKHNQYCFLTWICGDAKEILLNRLWKKMNEKCLSNKTVLTDVSVSRTK